MFQAATALWADVPEWVEGYHQFALTLQRRMEFSPEADREFIGWEPVDSGSVRSAIEQDLQEFDGRWSSRRYDFNPFDTNTLRRQIEVYANEYAEHLEHAAEWAPLLVHRQWLGTDDTGGLRTELWETRSLVSLDRFMWNRPGGLPLGELVVRFFALQSIAEQHAGVGWHIHPLDSSGRHLGYRLLFDADRTQHTLAWERHGTSLRRPWGDPGKKVLSLQRADGLYWSALRACRAKSSLRDETFRSWASRFAKPGASTFVACLHDPATREVSPPSAVTRW